MKKPVLLVVDDDSRVIEALEAALEPAYPFDRDAITAALNRLGGRRARVRGEPVQRIEELGS